MTTLTVSQVNFFLKSLIEGDGRLQNICIVGEISNFTDHYRSGHLYFTLKDDRAVLKAVMFATAAKRLQFRPQDGMKVLVRGRVSVYEASGQYQLYAEFMEPQGVGALSVAVEQLKERLNAEGLFAPEHKRPLPSYPQRIGVITSPTGAAVQDMLSVTARRWPLAEIVFVPVQVQGDAAAAQLTAAVQRLNRQNACDVILIGRGGGSLEDLWAFHAESLARAIYDSHIPVVSAVGHETDFTICDFVADVRAPTPSAAAELATPDQAEERLRLLSTRQALYSAMLQQLSLRRERLDHLTQKSVLLHPTTMLQTRREHLAALFGRMMSAGVYQLQERKAAAQQLTAQLEALSPLKVLLRGYAVVQNEAGEVIKNSVQLSPGQRVRIQLAQGSVEAQVATVKGEKADAD